MLSDWLVVEVTANPGEAFLDRMIALVEGAKRQKTPNEIALDILLAALTIVFLLATATLLPFSLYSVAAAGQGAPVTVTVLVALLVCLIPTTIGGLLSAIGIAGMDRMIQENVIAMSGRAVEAAGDVDVLLLDKTGTITLGNRQATAFVPGGRRARKPTLADAAQLASLADETPGGAQHRGARQGEVRPPRARRREARAPRSCPFTAQTRMSGVDLERPADPQGRRRRDRGPRRAARRALPGGGAAGAWTPSPRRAARRWSSRTDAKVLGVIQLKDIVKGGIRERFAQLRRMGIKTMMITGDNPLTAAAIAAEAGVDDFLAEATPEAKLKLIRDVPGARAGWSR